MGRVMGALEPLRTAPLPAFPGWRVLIGPGIVWMALAQGSGELIWWPYIIAKYGLTFLCLLVPACLLQYPLNYHIGAYTLLTGESIFQGFIRLHRGFAILLWVLMTVSFLWFGAFVTAGATAMVALTGWPSGWSVQAQTHIWAYFGIGVCLVAILWSRVVYRAIERIMWVVAVVTVVGLLWSCLRPEVLAHWGAFASGICRPQWPPPRPFDPADATKLLTAVTFAGLGGFWTLFYSYWLREKGIGMAGYAGKITGMRGDTASSAAADAPVAAGLIPAASSDLAVQMRRWRSFLLVDSGVGILGNLATTLMTCLLAYALLFPSGLYPQHYEIAVVQSRFFEVSWGATGRALFLVVAAAFLADTWLATVDAVSRIHTDVVQSLFPETRRRSARWWYYCFLGLLTVVTTVTMHWQEPGPLILTSAVIGFIGTVLFSGAVIVLVHRYLAVRLPVEARLGRMAMLVTWIAYIGLAAVYLWVRFV